MSMSDCGYSLPVSPGDAVKRTISNQVAGSWGDISPEKIEQINKIVDTTERLAGLAQIVGSSYDENLYSSDNIDAISDHLNRPELDPAPFNPAMVDRQRAIMNGDIQGTVYDQNWMRHELLEKNLMDQGMSYPQAHAQANKALGVEGDWDLWPTEMIKRFPDWLIGPAWRKPLSKRKWE